MPPKKKDETNVPGSAMPSTPDETSVTPPDVTVTYMPETLPDEGAAKLAEAEAANAEQAEIEAAVGPLIVKVEERLKAVSEWAKYVANGDTLNLGRLEGALAILNAFMAGGDLETGVDKILALCPDRRPKS
jgi:hypothetical protein